MIFDLIIVGSGPAGYSSAIYAKRAGLNPILITGSNIGGQLMQTTDVENYPGFVSITGPSLMENMKNQTISLGVELKNDYIKKLNIKKDEFQLIGSVSEYKAKAVVIATGSSAKWLGIKGEEEFRGFGVSACATCDGFFFQDNIVAVIGGGNSALEEALYLSDLAKKVYLIHRRDTFRGEKILQERVFAKSNIEIIYNSVTHEILGSIEPEKKVSGLLLENRIDNTTSILNVEGVFISIGHLPNTSFLKGEIDLDEAGYIKVHNKGSLCLKNDKEVNGLFAAGDVKEPIYKQAVVSAATGCIAALDAKTYLDLIK